MTAALQSLRESGRQQLAKAKTKARAAGVKVETALQEGKELTDRVAALAKEAQRSDADLIVSGTHGLRNSDRVILGSVAER